LEISKIFKMTRLLSFMFCIIYLTVASCCGPKCNKPKNKEETKSATIVGSDKDEHSCKASAGYQWSELKQECVRPFELPLSILSPDKTTMTSVLFSADSSQVEIFSVDGHFILEKSASGHYGKRLKNKSPDLDRNQIGEWSWVFEN
jgi:hypothetical protein